MQPKLFIALKAFTINNEKVLILRESSSHPTNTQADKYGLPGGRLKPGERFATGLMREVKEETGLDIKIGKPLTISEWRPKAKGEQWQIIGIFFLCNTDTNKVRLSEEHDHFQWVDPKDFNQSPIIATEVEAF